MLSEEKYENIEFLKLLTKLKKNRLDLENYNKILMDCNNYINNFISKKDYHNNYLLSLENTYYYDNYESYIFEKNFHNNELFFVNMSIKLGYQESKKYNDKYRSLHKKTEIINIVIENKAAYKIQSFVRKIFCKVKNNFKLYIKNVKLIQNYYKTKLERSKFLKYIDNKIMVGKIIKNLINRTLNSIKKKYKEKNKLIRICEPKKKNEHKLNSKQKEKIVKTKNIVKTKEIIKAKEIVKAEENVETKEIVKKKNKKKKKKKKKNNKENIKNYMIDGSYISEDEFLNVEILKNKVIQEIKEKNKSREAFNLTTKYFNRQKLIKEKCKSIDEKLKCFNKDFKFILEEKYFKRKLIDSFKTTLNNIYKEYKKFMNIELDKPIESPYNEIVRKINNFTVFIRQYQEHMIFIHAKMIIIKKSIEDLNLLIDKSKLKEKIIFDGFKKIKDIYNHPFKYNNIDFYSNFIEILSVSIIKKFNSKYKENIFIKIIIVSLLSEYITILKDIQLNSDNYDKKKYEFKNIEINSNFSEFSENLYSEFYDNCKKKYNDFLTSNATKKLLLNETKIEISSSDI